MDKCAYHSCGLQADRSGEKKKGKGGKAQSQSGKAESEKVRSATGTQVL